jgi:DNA-binding XRE family transcriptional regulator
MLEATLQPAVADKEAARCANCNLNQFMTKTGLCRRCRHSINGEPAKDAVSQPQTESISDLTDVAKVVFLSSERRSIDTGFAVKLLRLTRMMSQHELAAKVGMARTYISKVENNTIQPSATTFTKLARALDCPAALMIQIAEVPLAA